MTSKTPATVIYATVPDGIRRAGMHHPAKAVTHRAGTFTEDQLRALLDEPRLLVAFPEQIAPKAATPGIDLEAAIADAWVPGDGENQAPAA